MQSRAHFRLLGVPVRVELLFVVVAFLFALRIRQLWLIFAVVAVVFVSILVHEMGHALVYRFLGQRSAIVLHGFGGFTVPTGGGRRVLGKTSSITVSLAGIIAQLLLLYLPARYLLNTDWALEEGLPDYGILDGQLISNPDAGNWSFHWLPVLYYAQFINLWWAVFNALPIRPLDGGHVAEELLGHENACKVSIGAAIVGAFLALTHDPMYTIIALLMGLFAFQNYRELKDGGMGSSMFEVEAPDAPSRGGGRPGRSSNPGESGHPGRGGGKRSDRPSRRRRKPTHLEPVPPLFGSDPVPNTGASPDVEAAIWNELRDGDKDRAASMLRQAGSINQFLQGSVALQQGHAAIALELLEAAYRVEPDGPPNLVPATLLAETDQAVPLAGVLVDNGPDGVAAAGTLLTHLHYAGRFEQAARVGELVFAAGPPSPAQTAFEVACAWSRSGNSEEGMRWIEAAVDAGFKAPAVLDKEPDLLEVRAHPSWPTVRAKLA